MTEPKRELTDEKVTFMHDQLTAWLHDPCRARIAFATTSDGDVVYLTPMPDNLRAMLGGIRDEPVHGSSCGHSHAHMSFEFIEFRRDAWPDPPAGGEAA